VPRLCCPPTRTARCITVNPCPGTSRRFRSPHNARHGSPILGRNARQSGRPTGGRQRRSFCTADIGHSRRERHFGIAQAELESRSPRNGGRLPSERSRHSDPHPQILDIRPGGKHNDFGGRIRSEPLASRRSIALAAAQRCSAGGPRDQLTYASDRYATFATAFRLAAHGAADCGRRWSVDAASSGRRPLGGALSLRRLRMWLPVGPAVLGSLFLLHASGEDQLGTAERRCRARVLRGGCQAECGHEARTGSRTLPSPMRFSSPRAMPRRLPAEPRRAGREQESSLWRSVDSECFEVPRFGAVLASRD